MEIKNPTARQMIPVMIESTVTCGKVPSAMIAMGEATINPIIAQ